MNTEIDDRFRQLVTELADTAPEPLEWSQIALRLAADPVPARSRRPVALAAAGAVVVVGAGLAAAALLDDDLGSGSRRAVEDDSPVVTTGEPSAALGAGTAARCVEQYDLTTLANRDFAFDGTVTAIGTEPVGERDPESDPYVEVTFDVLEWFAPEGPDTVIVEMLPPDLRTSEGSVEYAVGSRLLITGEPRWGGATFDSPVAWYCGFSRTYDEATATAWREAFAAEG
jgi:hypothetical protein